MDKMTLIGIGASVFTSTALIPQLVKLIKEKKSEGTSMVMLVILFTGLVLWIYYGALRSDWIIIIANSFAALINLITGGLKIYYYRAKKRE